MEKITKIIECYDSSIIDIDNSNANQLTQLNLKIKTTQNCLNELRQEVKANGFNTVKEEIKFFKYQKPYIKGQLKFYINLNTYLINKPSESNSKIRKYINLQIGEISNDNYHYLDFINYMRLEETNMDNTYFLTGNKQFEFFIDNSQLFEDPEFCTARDNLASEIIANDLLSQFYRNELEVHKKKNSKQKIKEVQKHPNSYFSWTGTKTELVELVSSLNSIGVIGNGNLNAKQLRIMCKELFNIDPGNIYNILEQIKSRKSNPTKFLDKLSKSLLNDLNYQWQNS
jgi:hypothetical protein